MSIDSRLARHVKLEMDIHSINETHGTPDAAMSMTYGLTDFVGTCDGMEEFLAGERETFELMIEDGDPELDRLNGMLGTGFFRISGLRLRMSCMPDIEQAFAGGYNASESEFDGTVLSAPIEFYIVDSTPDGCMETLQSCLVHEFTHAYDDYRRRLNGGSLQKVTAECNMNLVHRLMDDCEDFTETLVEMLELDLDMEEMTSLIHAIGYFVYITSPFEQNAFISQIKGDLIHRKGTMTNSASIMNAIKTTIPYKQLVSAKNTVEHFEWLGTDEVDDYYDPDEITAIRQTILMVYNMAMKKPAKNYRNMLKRIRATYDKFEQKFMTTASKIGYDIYSGR